MNKRKVVYFVLGLLVVLLTFGLILGCGGGGTTKTDPTDGELSGLKTSDGEPYTGDIKILADGSPSGLTTQLTFVFNAPLASFTANDVTLSGVSGVAKGTMSDIGGGSASAYSQGSVGIISSTFSGGDDSGYGYDGSGYDTPAPAPSYPNDPNDPSNPNSVSYYGYRYVLPISGFTTSGTLTVKIGEVSTSVNIFYSTFEGGIYLGIIKFAGDTQAINLQNIYGSSGGSSTNNDAPILLTSNINNNIQMILQNQYQAASGSTDGSAVYYAVHKAMANLTKSENKFPVPDSVYIITFTDGKDNGSTGQSALSPIENETFDDEPGYSTYVQDQIANRKIAGKNIIAYSIGVRGNDIQSGDVANFTALLQSIAGTGKDKDLGYNSYSVLNATFDEIANGVIQGSNYILTTTLLASNTKVRMTFDLDTYSTPEQAAVSTKYIQGTVIRTGSGTSLTYTLTDISYEGITSDVLAGGSLTGTITGTKVNYRFNNITGYDAEARAKTLQWLMNPGTTAWTKNTEYESSNDVFGTTVIYLVLDCSSSISNNIYNIRDSVNNFISKIYNAYYSNN